VNRDYANRARPVPPLTHKYNENEWSPLLSGIETRREKSAIGAQSCSRTGLMELTLSMTREIPPPRCNLLRRAMRRASRIQTSSQRRRGIGHLVYRWQSRDSRNEQRIGLFNSLDKIEHVLKIIERLTGKPLRAKC
jgi:hypothetical protein